MPQGRREPLLVRSPKKSEDFFLEKFSKRAAANRAPRSQETLRDGRWSEGEFDAAGIAVEALVAWMATLCIRDADLILQEMLTRR